MDQANICAEAVSRVQETAQWTLMDVPVCNLSKTTLDTMACELWGRGDITEKGRYFRDITGKRRRNTKYEI